jgi:hypothetical protein
MLAFGRAPRDSSLFGFEHGAQAETEYGGMMTAQGEDV